MADTGRADSAGICPGSDRGVLAGADRRHGMEMIRDAAGGRGGGLILAAPASGSGKTLLTLGLLRRLRDRGWRVAAAKAGPDYIDPTFHAAASGGTCLNLDGWAMRETMLRALLHRLESGAD